ncbi:MAG: hypothetical protein QGI24_09515 [Kiritimatiellia bacterium]|jgi:hypothetical protein|nr:hypothetical protein [Kiritimatiellia bacterium]MDP6849013.1 hypothetical protein [Kiritimatiellia bacterium]
MINLATVSLVLGSVIGAFCIFLVLSPAMARNTLLALPRNKVAGWMFSGVGLLWAARLLWLTPLGRFENLKPVLVVLAPVTFLFIVFFMDELLGARALGGMFVLIPAPVLEATRGSDSPFRLVIVTLAYVMAVQGIALVLSPYLLRKEVGVLMGSNPLCRIWGVIGALLGVALIILGITLF